MLFALTGNVARNSRALRQLELLTGMGLRVSVLGLGSRTVEVPRVAMQLLPHPPGRGPRFFWKVHRQFARYARATPARVYHASDLYALPALAAAARHHGGTLVFDSRELYTHVAATTGRPWVRLAWHAVLRRYVGQARVVFTVGDRIATHLAKTYKISEPVVVHNVPRARHSGTARDLRRAAGIQDDHAILLHQGNIQRHRGCWALADAMHQVRGATLLFMGGGPLKAALQAYAVDIPRVRFIDAVPPSDLLSWTAGADVGLVMLEDTCLNHRYALPNKLFEYLAAGLPVVASRLDEIAPIVERFNLGMVVDVDDAAALVQTLQYAVANASLRRNWAANADRALETFSPAKASDRFLSAYRGLLC